MLKAISALPDATWPKQWGTITPLARYRDLVLMRPEGCPADRLWLVGSVKQMAELEAIGNDHQGIHSPAVPEPVGTRAEGDCAVLELQSSAIATLAQVVPVAERRGAKLEYAGAIAFNELMMDCVEAAHTATPPVFLSALSWRNLLLGRSGGVEIFGFGRAFPRASDDAPIIAPEVMLGASPSAPADVFALHGLLRGLLPYVELHPFFDTALDPQDESPLRSVLGALSAAASAPEAAHRPPNVAALRARYREVRNLVPDLPAPDPVALARYFAKLLTSDLELTVFDSERSLLIDRRRVDFASRPLLWRVFSALLSAHRASPGAPLALEALATAGWPGERIRVDSARARVYVALSSLRKAGLEGYIERVDGGWRLLKQLTVIDGSRTRL